MSQSQRREASQGLSSGEASAQARPHVALLGAANSIHLVQWARELHAQGWRVTVLSQHAAPAQGALAMPAGVELVALPHAGGLGYLRNAAALRRWLLAHRPTLLHAHYASGYGTTAALARWHPWLLSAWGSDVYDFPRHGRIARWLLRRNLAAADSVGSTSRTMAEQVRRVWPLAGRIAITPFGVDVTRFDARVGQTDGLGASAASAPLDRAGSSDGSPARPFVIGTVKTLASKYGIDTLIDAFAMLVRERMAGDVGGADPGIRLLIVGDGPERDALHARAATAGIESWTLWPGSAAHADVPGWLRRLDVYVAASRLDSESFGVAIVEAMAAARPVIVSDAGGLPETVDDGRAGRVVPRDDPAALATALRELMQDDAARAALARRGQQWARRRYAWPVCAGLMVQWYQDVLAAFGKPAQGDRRRVL